MAEIVCDGDEWGQGRVWWVEWFTNDGNFRECYFRTRKKAEQFALKIEMELLNESVARFNEAWAQTPPDKRRQFNEMVQRSIRPHGGKPKAARASK